MKTIMLQAINEYQCPGCVNGPNVESCPELRATDLGCNSHCAGTMGFGTGTFALGLPKGFNRFGRSNERSFEIHHSWDALIKAHPTLTTKFSVPVWKHLDEQGNTIVRWFSPRTNAGWSCVILGDAMNKMPNAIVIMAADVEYMD